MNTVISVKVDRSVKESAQEVAKSAGLTLSTLINVYLRQVAATRRIEIYAPEQMTPKLEGMIAEMEAEMAAEKAAGITREPFTNADDFLAALNS